MLDVTDISNGKMGNVSQIPQQLLTMVNDTVSALEAT
jgi:hypothetical protein